MTEPIYLTRLRKYLDIKNKKIELKSLHLSPNPNNNTL